jgi:hypothetical protein
MTAAVRSRPTLSPAATRSRPGQTITSMVVRFDIRPSGSSAWACPASSLRDDVVIGELPALGRPLEACSQASKMAKRASMRSRAPK